MTYDHSSTVLFIDGERVDVGAMSVDEVIEEFGEGSELERAINYDRTATGTTTAKLTRGQMRRLERVIGVVYGKGWTRARLPLSGCRLGWRDDR